MSTVFLSVLLRLFTLPTGSAPIQLEPIVISPLPLHQTNTNGFSAKSTALYTSCSPLLARFMADKGQPPTLSFLNVSVTKMFLLLSSSRSNTEVKKLSRNRWRGSCSKKWSVKEHFVTLHQTYHCSQCFVPYFLDKHQKHVNNQRDS